MLSKKSTRTIVSIILVGIAGVFCFWQLLVNFASYNQKFLESLKEVKPKLEALNASVLAEIHHADGVQVIQQTNLDLHAPAHDSYLYSEYKIIGGDNDNTLNFYKQELESLGWELSSSEDSPSAKKLFHHRDSVCIKLEFFPNNESNNDRFRISIKHDIRKQTFGIQPNNLLEALFFNLTFYNPCPP